MRGGGAWGGMGWGGVGWGGGGERHTPREKSCAILSIQIRKIAYIYFLVRESKQAAKAETMGQTMIDDVCLWGKNTDGF